MSGWDESRAAYLDFIAKLEQTFTPFAPIELPDFFVGRQREVNSLIRELNAPGRQVAIYGDRGVGKTSLALLCWFFAKRPEEQTHFVRCTKASTYQSVFSEVLGRATENHLPGDRQTAKTRRAGLQAKALSFGGSRMERMTERAINGAYQLSPGLLLDFFSNVNGLIVLDEFDRVDDDETHVKVAETLKHFSDSRSTTKFLIVGVAETFSQLLRKHESLTRCVAEIKLDRMSDGELKDILERGSKRLRIRFEEETTRKIVKLSDGYAHYTHLLARYATLAAVEESGVTEKQFVIGQRAYQVGLRDAIENAEQRLRETYEKAIIPLKGKTQLFQYAVWAIAMAEDLEVHISSIAEHISQISGEVVKPQACTYHLGKLVSEDRGQILDRVREGYYKFSDPLMRAYVRLQLEAYNIIERQGQMEFAFMKAGRANSNRGWAPPREV